MQSFWKDVLKISSCPKRVNIIDGNSGDADIIKNFTEKFLTNDIVIYGNNEKSQLLTRLGAAWQSENKQCVAISNYTLKNIIKKLKPGMGHDFIHTRLLTNASDEFLNNLCIFLNLCYRHCYLPADLLKGDIDPTIKDKKKNLTESSNYRPVMQSSCLLKIFEMHILGFLSEKISLNPRQFGFVKNSSTSDATFLLKNTISEYMSGKSCMTGLSVDLKQAFDRLNHLKLGNIMLDRNIPPDLVLIIMHYLHNTLARIRWNQSTGNYFSVERGVRQGGVLSPFLFNLYLDNVLNDISNMEVGCSLGMHRVNVIAYADDLFLLAPTIKDLGIIYAKFKNHMNKLNLCININKTKCIFFSNIKKAKLDVGNVNLNNDVFEIVTSLPYLGFYIDSNFDDSCDVQYRLKKFYSKFNVLFRNFNGVIIETFLFLFKTYCTPDYGLSIWSSSKTFRSASFKTFESAYSSALKKILGAPRYASSHIAADICSLPLLKEHVIVNKINFYNRLEQNLNPIIKTNSFSLRNGLFFKDFSNFFKNKYDIYMNGNDKDALISRIMFCQRNQQRTRLCPFFNF